MVQGASSKNPNVLRKHPRMRLACERVGGQMWSRQRPMRELEAALVTHERIGGRIGTLDVAHERIGGRMREFASKT
jgi:hypothetical protein